MARKAGSITLDGETFQLRERVHTFDDLAEEGNPAPARKIDTKTNPFFAKLFESYEHEYSCGAVNVSPDKIELALRMLDQAKDWLSKHVKEEAAAMGQDHPGVTKKVRFRYSEHGEQFTIPEHLVCAETGQPLTEYRIGKKRTREYAASGQPFTGRARTVRELPDKPIYIEFWAVDVKPKKKDSQDEQKAAQNGSKPDPEPEPQDQAEDVQEAADSEQEETADA